MTEFTCIVHAKKKEKVRKMALKILFCYILILLRSMIQKFPN
uniref:Uncharacterized protein n=1 Tax=Anguilla anguilla TaxID=7936 RepID=A0A0E9XL20_ANGAN